MRRFAFWAAVLTCAPLGTAGFAEAQYYSYRPQYIPPQYVRPYYAPRRSVRPKTIHPSHRASDLPQSRAANVFIAVDKASQSMTVTVDGQVRHRWPVSTGRDGGPPSGTFRPERLERSWFSRKYDWAPMPHSIFFYKGYAIHGTTEVSRLGNRASRGCVRLHPSHAAALFALVKNTGMGRTTIAVRGSQVHAGRP